MLCFLLGMTMLLSAACASSISPVVRGFSCRVSIVYADATYEGRLDRGNDGLTTLIIDQPSSLDGLTMTWDGAELFVSYGDQATAVSHPPVGAVVKALVDILDSGIQTVGKTVQGEGPCGTYYVCYNAQSGLPESIELPALSLAIRFSS